MLALRDEALTEGLTGENDVLFSAGITVQAPPRPLLLIWSVHKPQVSRWRLRGSAGEGEARGARDMSDNEERAGVPGASSAVCACVRSIALSTHTNRKEALTSKQREIQDTLESEV